MMVRIIYNIGTNILIKSKDSEAGSSGGLMLSLAIYDAIVKDDLTKGKKIAGDLLLNLSIGQYDTYTILELAQYMNTIANNGIRYKLNLVDHITDEYGNIIYSYEGNILNKINLDEKYYERIKEGLRQVLFLGTGYGYTNVKYKPAGKTGTSEQLHLHMLCLHHLMILNIL